MQFSLREILTLVVYSALVLASLRGGGALTSVVFMATIVFVMGATIVAMVSRGRQRVWAIGFLAPVAIYAVVVYSAGKDELDPYDGKVPTTKWLAPAFEAIVQRTWIDAVTMKEIKDYDPQSDANAAAAMAGGFGGGMGGGMNAVMSRESPDRATFMLLAHAVIATVLGYVGAKFAVWFSPAMADSGDSDPSG